MTSKKKTTLGRRELLRSGGLALAAVGCSSGAGPEGAPAVKTRQRVRWRLASSFPRSLDTIFGAAEVLADRVAALSGGLFEIRCYPSGELVPPLQVLDAVQQGTVQAGHTASYYYTGKNPVLAFDTAVPYGLTARQQTAWLVEGGGLEAMRGVFADFSILNFPCGNTGTQMGGWFRNPLEGKGDLRGLKMRIPGLGAQVLANLGVTVQTIAGGETYPALERGAIDATEWVGPYDDEKLGFFRVAKNYYYPGWWEPGPGLSLLVSQAAWDALSSEYQQILQVASFEAHVVTQARYDALNPQALTRLLQQGVQLRPFPDDIMQATYEASMQLLEDEAAKDATYRQIHEAWKSYRSDSYSWFKTAELAFQKFSFSA